MPKTDTPALAAAQAEAGDAPKPVEFSYDDTTYTASSDAAEDIDAREHLEDGNMTLFARALLGPEQWRRFKSKKRTYDDALNLVNAWSDAAGLGK